MTPARDIEDRAARWLIRSEDPEWSSADQGELEAWLEESMAHKAAYWRLEHGWREADRKSTRLNSSHIQKSRMPSSA